MNDLIERLRLGDGTSADHELLLEAADALEALAQPKQKPLAWISTGPATMIHWTADKPAYGDDWVPLYTAPPQRTWVGLTDAEIKDILDCGRGGLVDIKKTEAKLKEKNTRGQE